MREAGKEEVVREDTGLVVFPTCVGLCPGSNHRCVWPNCMGQRPAVFGSHHGYSQRR